MVFQERQLYEDYKKIRNALRKYSSYSVIFAIASKLNQASTIETFKRYPPHALLLLLKWTFMWGEFQQKSKPNISDRDLDYILGLWHEMNGHVKMPSDYESVNLFFRNLAYQQFWLQRNIHTSAFTRQHLLFRRIEKNHYFNTQFRQLYEIELSEFLDLCMGLVVFLLNEEGAWITKSYFDSIANEYSGEVIDKFFNIISGDFFEHQRYFFVNKQPKIMHQFYERSDLRLSPLLRFDKPKRFLVLSRSLLSHFLTDGLYELLRRPDPESFMQKFGSIFEEYVHNSFSYSQQRFEYSDEIQNVCSNKAVDFVFVQEESLIYVDAKGVEMAYLGQVTSDPNVISNKIKTSVLKGITQAFETNQAYKDNDSKLVEHEPFLIVVTFKELCLGSGKSFGETIGSEYLEKKKEEYPEYAHIPAENMFFIDVQELDQLCEILRSTNNKFEDILRMARDRSSDPKTDTFFFEQHLQTIEWDGKTPDYLQAALDQEIDKFAGILK